MQIGETEEVQQLFVEKLVHQVVCVLEEAQVLFVALALVLHVPHLWQFVIKVPARPQDLLYDHVGSGCRLFLNFGRKNSVVDNLNKQSLRGFVQHLLAANNPHELSIDNS